MFAMWIALGVFAQKTVPTAPRVRADAMIVREDYAACMVEPYEHDFEWIPAGDMYQCGVRTIPRSSVEALRRLVLASREDPPDIVATLGLTSASVEEHREDILGQLESMEGDDSRGHPFPLHDGVEVLLRFEVVSQAVLDEIRFFRKQCSTTFHEIRVTLPGEQPITITSQGRLGWLLPWQVEAGNRTWKSPRIEISQAILPLIDVDSPGRYLLDGASYWREWFWSDFFFWSEQYDNLDLVLAAERYEKLPGFAEVAPWFSVDSSRAGMSGDSMAVMLDLSALTSCPIQRARWWNPLMDQVPSSSWNDFLAVWEKGVDVVRCHDWIEGWRMTGADHRVRLIASGTKAFLGRDRNESVVLAWKHAGLSGEPAVEIELQRGAQTSAVVFLSPVEPGALILSAIPGAGKHWLDQLDVSFHPRTPTYVCVDASGKPEIRSMAPFPDPSDCNWRGCR